MVETEREHTGGKWTGEHPWALLGQLTAQAWARVARALTRFTREQLAVVDAVVNTGDNLIVESTAGSGKSTLLEALTDVLPRPSRIGVFAYNRTIARELRKRLAKDLTCATLHAHGRAIIEEHSPRDLVTPEHKRKNITDAYLKRLGLYSKGTAKMLCALLVLTMTHLTPPRAEEIAALTLRHEFEFRPL
ncbi:hypothetical protein DAETH_37450 (plasmid) [Deinococcus aetherius]|uniref:Uncharacterized protein n=1 Tax=Deinococcus aetherius TaxID=200252 RepID=A0ABN6RN76_9DEIO|nr:AAA family ATPase [Deinococcus aetherius]BDP43776.1 hypothetical protein DAETH_37450 [Deinococcus aetherius]